MATTYTHITVILDRSGSMETIRKDTIGGFNAFLKAQQKLPEKATLTLVQFDSQDPYEVVCHFKPLEEVAKLTVKTFVPRGATPLLDAMGRGINDLAETIGKMTAKQRPDKVMLVVVTDGQENSSREFSKKQVEKLIKERTKRDEWQFVYLSSDMNAVHEAHGLGFDANATMAYRHNTQGVDDAWSTLSASSVRYRSAVDKSMNLAKPKQQGKKGKQPDTPV